MQKPAFDALRERQLRAVATAFLRFRPIVIGSAFPFVIAALVFSGVPREELLTLGSLFLAGFGFFVFEAFKTRRDEIGERWLLLSLLMTVILIFCVCLASGAIRSPLLLIVFAPVVTLFAAFGRARQSVWAFVLAVVLGAVLALAPPDRLLPALPEAPARFITLVALVVSLLLLHRSVTGLTDAYRRSGEELDRIRNQALDDAKERMQSLERLAGRLAHELKNPLSAIKALVQLLGRSHDVVRTSERASVLLSEIDRMERILEEHLSFARPLGELRCAPVDLAQLGNDVLGLFEARAAEAGLALVNLGAPVIAEVDRVKLREALVNLIANAIEATPRGGRITIGVEASGSDAMLEVADTGRGMPESVLARVGTPFFTTRTGGTGLGVVIARGIAEQHGGRLVLESEPGRGTKATLSLPRSRHEAVVASGDVGAEHGADRGVE